MLMAPKTLLSSHLTQPVHVCSDTVIFTENNIVTAFNFYSTIILLVVVVNLFYFNSNFSFNFTAIYILLQYYTTVNLI